MIEKKNQKQGHTRILRQVTILKCTVAREESLIKVTFEDPNELTLWMPGEERGMVWLETHR